MSALSALTTSPTTSGSSNAPRPAIRPARIAVGRAVLALVWAAALVLLVGHRVPTPATDLPVGVAAVLASYPLIDVIASLATATITTASRRLLQISAAISALAVGAIAATAFASDAGATLIAFGAWAAVSGALQLGIALTHRHSRSHQLPMIVSGAISTVAGIGFIAMSGAQHAHVANLGGYMAFGAVLFLVGAAWNRSAKRTR